MRCGFLRSRQTAADTWLTTLMKVDVITQSAGHHEVSNPKAAVVSWIAERMGPTIIAAPHRGHVQVVQVSAAGAAACASVAAADMGGLASNVRARITRAVRQVFARNP